MRRRNCAQMSLYGRGPASGPEVSDGLLAFVDGLVPLGSDLLLPQQVRDKRAPSRLCRVWANMLPASTKNSP